MLPRLCRAFLVCLVVFGFIAQKTDPAGAASDGVVISQVYGGGGNSGATLKNDFIELFNRGSSPVNLNGWSVQYVSAAGTGTWLVTPLSNFTLQPGQYYLVQEAVGAGGTQNLPTPDATGTIAMSATNAKVALLSTTAALTGGCPSSPAIVDLVGYGTGSSQPSCFEGAAPAPTLTNTTADIRAGHGCTDTDANGSDFSSGAPTPRNSATPLAACSGTNPSGTLAADAQTYNQGDPITLIVTVVPGTGPASTGITVTADLSSIGLGSASFHDDGLNGDQIANDNKFTFSSAIPGNANGGVKTLSASISDAQSRTATTPSISITLQTPTAPTGAGSAIPSSVPAGTSTQLTVTVTSGTNPVSTNLAVSGDLSSIVPGDTAHAFVAGANNTFTLSATVDPATTPGAKSLPITITDGQGRSSGFTLALTVTAPLADSTIVISEVYGGGGNSGATYQNDFVQLYNRGGATVDLTGWSLQYASAAGTSWDNKQPLGGTLAPGHYYLVALGSGGANGSPTPPANISGQINMSQTTGKIALVDNGETLSGPCPISSPHVRDFVGYGASATCHEGTGNAPQPGPAVAIFRRSAGFLDTNDNVNDFETGLPNPFTTETIVEIGPAVLTTDPLPGAATAPRDATIEVSFTEPVDVSGAWFHIVCSTTGVHDDATTAAGPSARDQYITPNVNFVAGETCTVTIFKNQVSDQDTDDFAPNTDHLPADYTWAFSVATGTAPPYPASVHLTMGNPSHAVADTSEPNNYLMMKPEYALSYNRDKGRPNWVSWHLTPEWFGTLTRVDTFRADPQIPPDWYRVESFSFQSSGFDRGHMTPNADRDLESSIAINQATYLMSNMVAQAPDNNQGPWANFENYLRSLLGTDRVNPPYEIYVVAGPSGSGGTGSSGFATTIDNGRVEVPAYTWKVALVLPFDRNSDDVSRVTCAARTIAVIMPNVQGIRTTNSNDWTNYLTTVDAVEGLTGYDLFSNVPQKIQNCIQAGINGNNPEAQEITFAPIPTHTYGDAPFAVTATSDSGLPVALAVTSGPATIDQNGVVHLTGTGTVTVEATQSGGLNSGTDTTYARAVPVDQTFFVTKATTTFTSLSSPSIEAGTATTTIGGVITANGLIPEGAVAITVAGATIFAAVLPDGHFSASFSTASLSAAQSPYSIGFAFPTSANFTAANATTTLTVGDTTPPAIGAVSASPNVVTVPNHQMFGVVIDYSASDISGAPACSLAVTSNERANGVGDGNTAVDWSIIDAHHLQLRAERSGVGTGRIYDITVTCVDAFGNAATNSTTVMIPK